jgi:Zn-dependent peptidase ImmA (M78 family)
MKSFEVTRELKEIGLKVKPDVIAWAIDSSGWKTEDLAEKLKTNKIIIDRWTTGDSAPSIRQLEELSRYLKRPLSVFFLSQPPHEEPPPSDFRTLSKNRGEFDKETLLVLRRARRLQRLSRELSENLDTPLKPLLALASLSDNASEVGRFKRQELHIIDDTQMEWSDYEEFAELRSRIEELGIFVFQMRMPLPDARGFALVDEPPPVIVLNTRDHIRPRIFTLIHELGHVLLKISGIDSPEASISNPRADKVEKWCNEFAAEFLLPRALLEKEVQKMRESISDEKVLIRLSNRFNVSKSMLLYKLLKTDLVNYTTYSSMMDVLRSKGPPPEEEGGIGVPQDVRCLRERGNRFVSLVSRNIEKGSIDYGEAVDLLSVRLVNVDKVISRAQR